MGYDAENLMISGTLGLALTSDLCPAEEQKCD